MDELRAATDEPAPANVIDEDAVLMLAYADGDAAAFNRLYERHERPVYRFLLRSLAAGGSDARAIADELHQEVWMSVVCGAARYQPVARFTTWLYGIARNRLIDHWRARRPEVSLDEPLGGDSDGADADSVPTLHDLLPSAAGAQPETRTLWRAQNDALLRAVEALPPPQRETFLLHVEGELTLAEIGELTGVGMETAKSRLRYAMTRLRGALAGWR